MQIVCPACTAAYEVPPTLLKPGQVVRCARCAREWVPSPAAPEAPMEAPAEAKPAAALPKLPPPPEPPRETDPIRPAPRPPMARSPTSRANVVPRLAWAASVVAVLLLGWGAYAGRSAIMHAWPPSIRLYAALGLAAGR
jgi:predicted Zn finger-like uncharacterized protein